MTYGVHNLSKRYGATHALSDVSLTFSPGTVHALLGHNGAGKSTVIRCLGGGTAPTSGTIEVDGESTTQLTPRASRDSGVAIIYQHLSLVDTLSVSDNLFLGDEYTRCGMVDQKRQHLEAKAVLTRVGANFDSNVRVAELSMGSKQLVEIAKALRRDARLLVLDEPTAALSRVESARLAKLIDKLRSEGMAIVYVTHLLDEVVRLADRVTVLQNGSVVWSSAMEGVTKTDLVRAIGGSSHPIERQDFSRSKTVLALEGLMCGSAHGIDLAARTGEIIGLYGLVGSGRTRLLETIFGARKRTGGKIIVDGKTTAPGSPAEALSAGIALIPADRLQQGLFSTMTAADNIVLPAMAKLASPFRKKRQERLLFEQAVGNLQLHPANPRLPAGAFSGGNQQKILIGRWLTAHENIRVLLVDDPTQGVDVGARAEIYRVIQEAARHRGLTVLVASNDPEEIVSLADRCLIFDRGSVVSDLPMAGMDESRLLTAIHTEPAH
ncbi:sugar ABC transporter ATP-binding protein [Paenarthrobacter sp. YAF11_1]|uniref:sugar ABC transporter ATP-binding protein n=1 Tax=Paenarthrobacter sp. YAF11_1 TaxID=3233074 RepID=UPI003F948535